MFLGWIVFVKRFLKSDKTKSPEQESWRRTFLLKAIGHDWPIIQLYSPVVVGENWKHPQRTLQ